MLKVMSTTWLNSLAVPRKKMAKAEAKQASEEPQPNVHIEEAQENDDFVVIDMIGEKDGDNSDASRRESCYEDFVELSIEDAPSEAKGEDKEVQKCLYGIRLFQYSEESEGNIFIRNEDL